MVVKRHVPKFQNGNGNIAGKKVKIQLRFIGRHPAVGIFALDVKRFGLHIGQTQNRLSAALLLFLLHLPASRFCIRLYSSPYS